MKRLSLVLALTLAASHPAAAFQSINGLPVRPVDGERFQVSWRGLSGDTAFWCAAADYGLRGLGLPYSAHIWRISEPPRRQGRGSSFSTSPEGAASRSGITTIGGTPRADMTIASAINFCDERIIYFKDK